MRFGLYVYNHDGMHHGAQWFGHADRAWTAFVGQAKNPYGTMLVDGGDCAVAEAVDGQVFYAWHAMFQAPEGRRQFLRLLPRVERQCPFCREVFLPSRRMGEGDPWEREQHTTNCCSDACWEQAMGAPKTLRFKVELRAFADGAIREVKIPASLYRKKGLQEIREAVFKYGQNDVQPQALPSVSVGDVIRQGADRWVIMATGFEKEPEPIAAGGYDERDQT